MEQKHNYQINKTIRLSGYGQFATFAAFIGFSVYFLLFAFGTAVQGLLYAALALGMPLYAAGLKYTSLKLTSTAWFILGSFMTVAFVALNPSPASSFALFLLVLLIIASYEQTRFSFSVDPVIRIASDLNEEAQGRLARVIRNHALTAFQVIALSLLASVVVLYLSESLTIIVNPPIISVPIFVSISILVVVSVTISLMSRNGKEREDEEGSAMGA